MSFEPKGTGQILLNACYNLERLVAGGRLTPLTEMEASSGQQADRPDARNVQGNVVGFNKDHQVLAFLKFADSATGRAFLTALEPDVSHGREVERFNTLFREIHDRRGGASDIVQASWTNVALTHAGLSVLGASGLEAFPEEFRLGMAARAEAIGDKDDSAPASWIPPFSTPQELHAIIIMAADQPDDLQRALDRIKALAEENSVTVVFEQPGEVRQGEARGHEHFGFKDGISQPTIDGLTHGKAGSESIAAGEFLIGYPDQDGVISGQPQASPPEGQPGYNPIAPPQPLPEWCRDGSFLVFRRLRQNVAAFDDFVEQQAAANGLNANQLGAKLVGRWKSGAPLERTHSQDAGVDPSDHDPSVDDPSLLTARKINDFDYDQDPDGALVPRAAHIRKTNPRGADPPGLAESNRHRILRRGIPYGPDFSPGEPAYPGAGQPPPDDQDRGLLFLCYQSSIARGFEFIQAQWANKDEFPQPGDGRDQIISQDLAPRNFHLTPQGVNLTSERWVQTTGGEYFFAPSMSALRSLAAGEA